MDRIRQYVRWSWVPVVLGFFFLADPAFFGVDKRIYSQYAASVVEDFDLNVVNQIPEKETWLLTTTLNYPDVHSNGVAIWWAPFFGIAKALTGGTAEAYRAVETLTNVFFGMIGILFLWSLLRKRFNEEPSIVTMVLLLLGTPFYWYLVQQPENADITSFAMIAGLLLFYDGRAAFTPARFAFLFGLALFSCVAVKFDTIFSGLLLMHFLWERRRGALSEKARVLAGFSFGALPLIVLILLNEKIKSGFFDYPYMSTLTAKIYLLGEILTAPSGYLRSNPFFFLLIGVFVAFGTRRKTPSEYWFFLAIPVVELALESFNYAHNEGYGARHWVNDIPYFALLTGFLLTRSSRIERKILIGGAVLSGFIGVLSAFVYKFDFFNFYFTGDWIASLRNREASDWIRFLAPNWTTEKLRLWPALALALLLLFLAGKRISGITRARSMAVIFGLYALSYAIVTAGNVANNHLSPKKVEVGLLRLSVIGFGPHINSYFENAGCLERAADYYKVRGDARRAKERRDLLEDYARRASSEIVQDPVGFREKLEPGRERYVPDSLRTDD